MVGRENHPRREKATRGGEREFFSLPSACHLFSRGVIFTCARVSHALLSLRKNGGLLVLNLHHSQSPHFPSVLHCLAKFAFVKLQCGSGLGSRSFILDFSLLSGPWPWESKFCAQVSKPLCKLLVENKQKKQLIDRAKPNDGWCTPNLPTVPFHYHFDLYGGILTKTLVEKRSVFLSLLQ